eukprot:1159871-Pelagomonas_calceolata.AAC.8
MEPGAGVAVFVEMEQGVNTEMEQGKNAEMKAGSEFRNGKGSRCGSGSNVQEFARICKIWSREIKDCASQAICIKDRFPDAPLHAPSSPLFACSSTVLACPVLVTHR